MYKKYVLSSGIALAMPVVVAAANVQNIQGLVHSLVGVMNSIIPLLFGLAILSFFWGVITYIWNADPTKIAAARNYMMFSIVGIAVMLSVWALALLVKNSLFPSSPPVYNPYTGQVNPGGSAGSGGIDNSGGGKKNPGDTGYVQMGDGPICNADSDCWDQGHTNQYGGHTAVCAAGNNRCMDILDGKWYVPN